jgi:hypothetical protein
MYGRHPMKGYVMSPAHLLPTAVVSYSPPLNLLQRLFKNIEQEAKARFERKLKEQTAAQAEASEAVESVKEASGLPASPSGGVPPTTMENVKDSPGLSGRTRSGVPSTTVANTASATVSVDKQ